MIRWFFKILIIIILAALVYGLWLLYQDKTPEEKRELREGVTRAVRNAGRTVAEAGKRVVEKGKEIFQESEEE